MCYGLHTFKKGRLLYLKKYKIIMTRTHTPLQVSCLFGCVVVKIRNLSRPNHLNFTCIISSDKKKVLARLNRAKWHKQLITSEILDEFITVLISTFSAPVQMGPWGPFCLLSDG